MISKKTIVAAALALATITGAVPVATAAQAQTWVSISYRDNDYRDYRHDYRHHRDWRHESRRWDRDRDGIPNRYDRYDNRRGWAWNDNRYRRCWTEWRYDRWRDERVPTRICR